MREDQLLPIVVAGAFVVVVIVFVAISRRTGAIGVMLRELAASAGWTNVQKLFMSPAGVKGTWRSFPVELSYHLRQKGVPQRLILKVRAQTDSRLMVKRRFTGFFSNRPLTWFGPPLIEVRQPAAAEFWIRGDEAALAERLFGDSAVASVMYTNLVARFDEIRLDRRGLRITRALDDHLVTAKYAMPRFAVRLDVTKFEPIAREELALAEALVNKLSMLS
ncbi:MAG TPA: hypothetical protein VGK31_14580 [Thermoanaerobaculia bacterium]|jgi:hypothetical protein